MSNNAILEKPLTVSTFKGIDIGFGFKALIETTCDIRGTRGHY